MIAKLAFYGIIVAPALIFIVWVVIILADAIGLF